jgi:hypothetical protein
LQSVRHLVGSLLILSIVSDGCGKQRGELMPGTTLMHKKFLPWKKYLVTIICLVTIGLAFLWPGIPVDAEQPQTDPGLVIRIVPAIQEVVLGDTFVINVLVEGATDLGAFQFNLLYDPTIVIVADVALGPFMGSTGRTTNPLGPTIEVRGSASIVSFGAYTYGSQPGPQGDGVLATVTLTAVGSGTSTLQLQNVQVTDTVGNVQLASVEGGTVVVGAPAPASTPTPIPTLTSAEPSTPTSIATATQTPMPVTTTIPVNTPTATAGGMVASTSSAMLATTAVPTMTTPTTTTPTDTRLPTPSIAASQAPNTAAPQLAEAPTAIPTAVAPQSKPSSAPFSDLTPLLMDYLSLLGCLIFGGLFTLIAGYGLTTLLSRRRDRC